MTNFIGMSAESPAYGEPVLLRVMNTVQHITYTLVKGDGVSDHFVPFYFDNLDSIKIATDLVDGWVYLSDL